MKTRHGPSARRTGCCSAFTLMEVLLVVSVIVILMAVLLPVLSKVRGAARSVMCNNNLSRIATAAYAYANDNDGWILGDSFAGAAAAFWAVDYAPYMGMPQVKLSQYAAGAARENFVYDVFLPTMPVLQCPSLSLRDTPLRLHYTIVAIDFDAYSISTANPPNYSVGPAYMKLETIPGSVSKTAYIVEVNQKNTTLKANPKKFGDYVVWKREHFPFTKAGAKNPDPRAMHADEKRHSGTTNIGFYDGRASSHQLTFDELPPRVYNPLE